MNLVKVSNAWGAFRRSLDVVIRCGRYENINQQFELHPDFRHKDLNDMINYLDSAIKNIQIIREELQK